MPRFVIDFSRLSLCHFESSVCSGCSEKFISFIDAKPRFSRFYGPCIIFYLGSFSVLADDLPSVTPYRPTISNPAELSAPKHLEIEAGFEHGTGAGLAKHLAAPVTLKYAFNEDWGVLLNTGWLYDDGRDGSLLDGWNSTSLLIKHRHLLDDVQALGIEFGLATPANAGHFTQGQPDLLLNTIYSVDIDKTRVDGNLGFTRLGDTEAAIDRHQTQWALAVSHSVTDDWSLAAEWAGNVREGASAYNQLLVCAAYGLSRTMVIDIGGAYGLSGDSAATQNVFMGISWLID
jgi:hypothetical protein